jgi:ribosomal-protein-alanine N-acetyltransferase
MDDSAMVGELRIEPMKLADLTEVLTIERCSFRIPWSRASFESELEKPYSGLEVASLAKAGRDRAILGYVCFWCVADEIQITNLAVHVDTRRLGVGRRLLLHALRQGYRAGARLAFLEVRSSNEAAHALYEGLGFVVVQERPNYYPEYREAALVLALNLDSGWWQQWHMVN